MEHKVGDRVWVPVVGNVEVQKECPICYGKKVVRMELGNGDIVVVACEYCAQGYQPPRGFVTEYEYRVAAEQVRIEEVRSQSTDKGTKFEYLTGHYLRDTVYDTEEEAKREAERQAAEQTAFRIESELKKKKSQNYSWAAGYHMREAKRDRESADRHEMLARICKERARDGKVEKV